MRATILALALIEIIWNAIAAEVLAAGIFLALIGVAHRLRTEKP